MGSIGRSKLIRDKSTRIKNAQGFEAWFFIMAIMLAVAIFLLVLNRVWSDIKPELNAGLSSAAPASADANVTKILDQTSGVSSLLDKLFPFLIIGLFGFLLIIAGTIMKHGAMIFVGIIILGVIVTLAVIYSNVYNSISNTDEFSTSKSELRIQDKFMQYLPYIVFIGAIAIVIGLLMGRGSNGGSGL